MDSPHDLIEFIKNLNIDILGFFLHKLKICSYQNYEIKNGGHRAELKMFAPCAPPFVHFSISE